MALGDYRHYVNDATGEIYNNTQCEICFFRYIENIIKNSRSMTAKEQKAWRKMDEEISEVVEI